MVVALVASLGIVGVCGVPTTLAPLRPAQVVVGAEGELSRVVFSRVGMDPFVLTNGGDGTLSLTLLDKPVLGFGVVKPTPASPVVVAPPVAAIPADKPVESPKFLEVPAADALSLIEVTDEPKKEAVKHYLRLGSAEVDGVLKVGGAAHTVGGVPQWSLVSHDDFETGESRGRW